MRLDLETVPRPLSSIWKIWTILLCTTSYLGATNAIDHNGYTKGNSFFLANYTAGIREIDIQNIASGVMEEVGFFDTYPSNNGANFNGVWSVYPYFESGVIVISDSNSGLFLVKASE